jgi:plastocyanin
VSRRTVSAIAASAALVAAVAAGPATAGKVTTVELGTSYYAPAKKTIAQGEKVRFRWNPSFDMHDVNVKSGPQRFHSPLQAAGTYTRKFTKAGRYVLYCSQHTDMGMTLTVKKRKG